MIRKENKIWRFGIGPPTLRVRDLESELSFYEGDLGLARTANGGGETVLRPASQDSPLLILNHDPKASNPTEFSAGLYHFAILVPDRTSLASTYLSLGSKGVLFEGFSDHVVSEALYLRDPEGNGIEIYRDRPREEWRLDSNGSITMDTLPLDIDSLILELSKKDADLRKNPRSFPHGASIGHIHLKVTNLERSRNFYRETLRMDIVANRIGGASFLSYQGYHHHVGINTWESLGGLPRNSKEIGLDNFVIETNDHGFMEEFRTSKDVDRNALSSDERDGVVVSDPDAIKIIVRQTDAP
jgi:catechol 2,3-dioxygenase